MSQNTKTIERVHDILTYKEFYNKYILNEKRTEWCDIIPASFDFQCKVEVLDPKKDYFDKLIGHLFNLVKSAEKYVICFETDVSEDDPDPRYKLFVENLTFVDFNNFVIAQVQSFVLTSRSFNWILYFDHNDYDTIYFGGTDDTKVLFEGIDRTIFNVTTN